MVIHLGEARLHEERSVQLQTRECICNRAPVYLPRVSTLQFPSILLGFAGILLGCYQDITGILPGYYWISSGC